MYGVPAWVSVLCLAASVLAVYYALRERVSRWVLVPLIVVLSPVAALVLTVIVTIAYATLGAP